LTAESDVTAHSVTTSGKSLRFQKMRPESTGINDFNSTVARRVFGSTGLESVFGWHPSHSLFLHGMAITTDGWVRPAGGIRRNGHHPCT
jgi:hypothetical protein